MPIKTPQFWYRKEHDKAPLIETLLSPLMAIYIAGHRLNLARQERHPLPIPLICVGNIVAGGGGKTPTLLALHKLIMKHAIMKAPYFLSRGYGGSETGPHLVDPVQDGSSRVGDEPLLLARAAKTIVSLNRYDGVTSGHASDSDLILMDDGFQNQSILKDISFLVIDGVAGFGNMKFLPAGPLREPIEDGMARADAVILIGSDERNVRAHIPDSLPVFEAQRINRFNGDLSLSYVAFAGLARPEKFMKTLEEQKLNVAGFHSFADHHPYTAKDMDKLIAEAENIKAQLITTEKDFVRIPAEYKSRVVTFPIEIEFADEDAVAQFLKGKLQARVS